MITQFLSVIEIYKLNRYYERTFCSLTKSKMIFVKTIYFVEGNINSVWHGSESLSYLQSMRKYMTKKRKSSKIGYEQKR